MYSYVYKHQCWQSRMLQTENILVRFNPQKGSLVNFNLDRSLKKRTATGAELKCEVATPKGTSLTAVYLQVDDW